MSTKDPEDFSKTHCDCCLEDIPGIGIECLDCTRLVQLCCECFGLGAKIGRHKPQHRYRFFDCSGDLFLFPQDPTWTAEANLRLLNAIEHFGHGDWKSITAYIQNGTADSKKIKVFINPETGKLTWPLCKSFGPKLNFNIVEDGPLRPSFTAKMEPLLITSEEGSKLGCMPQTDDYEKEYDNDAEELISRLKYNPDDEEIEFGLQLTMVDMYTTRLRERVRRKRVIREYQLVHEFFKRKHARGRKKCGEVEGNIIHTLKPYTQFYSANQHSHIVQTLMKEFELVLRLQELYKYRLNGITNRNECALFDKILLKKKEKAKAKAKLTLIGNGTINGSTLKHRKRKKKRQLLTHQKTHSASVLRRRLAVHRNNKFLNRKNGTSASAAAKFSSKMKKIRNYKSNGQCVYPNIPCE